MEQLQGITSWYSHKLTLNNAQVAYCKFLMDGFMVDNAYGEPIPYDMTPYQIEFHSQSFNILREDAKDILFIKARGISFTFSSLIELIISATIFEKQVIPIISQRKDSAKDTLNTCKKIISNCKIKEIVEDAEFTETSEWIKFKSTGSVIKIYPSATAADAIRGRRLLRGIIDEFAFQTKDKELWAAVENCMQHGVGQIMIGSTPCGRQNLFYEFVDAARKNEDEIGMYLFDLPVFKPNEFNPKKPIHEQPHLVPVAPWINLQKLEIKRKRDWRIFMQEQMCDFLDDSLSLISYAHIMRCITEGLINLKDRHNDYSFQYTTTNRVFAGADVAEKSDLFAVVAYEELVNDEGMILYRQIYLDYFNGKTTPELEEYCNRFIQMFPSLAKFRIDETGIGTGLVNYLKKSHGGKIEGIHFSSSVFIGENRDKAPVRKVMISNLKRMIEDEQIILLDDPVQVKHINSVDYGFKIPHSDGDGHSDLLFANCLALLKSKFRLDSGDVRMTTTAKSISSPTPQMSLSDKLKHYKRAGGIKTFNINDCINLNYI